MSEALHFVRLLRLAPRSDVFVLLTCFLLTVFFDMVVAVSVGPMIDATETWCGSRRSPHAILPR